MNDSKRPESHQPQPTVAGIYCRISLAAFDDKTKVDDQERICRDLATRSGWQVASGCGYPDPNGVYQDNNRSAWQQKRKRPAWDQMLADVEAGKISAIVVYHGDRLLRTHEDLLALIHLARARGVKLTSPAGTRDLGNYDDQFILEIEASMAKRESANTSRRRKAQYERWRREGRVRPGGVGGRAFGFATDGLTLVPAECELLRGAASRILDGQPTGQVVAWLNGQGAVTPAGRPFAHGTVRKMLARPRYAGLMPDAEHPAAWEPVYDSDRTEAVRIWEQVCAVLNSRAAKFAYTTNVSRYLLSGIAVCSECGSGLQIRAEHHRPQATGYGCVKPGCRKVQRSAAHLDAYVTGRLVARLANPLNPAGRVADDAAVRAEIRTLMQLRGKTEAQVTDYQASPGRVDLLMRRLDSIDARLDQLRERAAGDARSRILEAHAGITRGEFGALSLATRRALVSACFTVTVLPAGRRGPGFDPALVHLDPR